MPRPQAKDFATPDDVRAMPKFSFATVEIDDATVTGGRFDPGSRRSTDIGPIIGTASCQIHHLGYAISGAVRCVRDDGQTLDIGPIRCSTSRRATTVQVHVLAVRAGTCGRTCWATLSG